MAQIKMQYGSGERPKPTTANYLIKNGRWVSTDLPMSIITSGNFSSSGFEVTQENGYVRSSCYGTTGTGNMGWNLSSADANTWLAYMIAQGFKYLNITLQTEAIMSNPSSGGGWTTKLKIGYTGSAIIDETTIYSGADSTYSFITTTRKIDISASTSFYLNCLSQRNNSGALGTTSYQQDRIYQLYLSKE